MISLVLLLFLWPFHHKKPEHYVITETVIDGCEVADNLYFYLGEDNMIGFGASCEEAKHNWSLTHIDPVKMSRA